MRLAFGLASAREARQAQLHLAGCARCGALYERLDCWREKVAALLPLPAADHAPRGAIEAAIDRIADGVTSVRHHGAETLGAARQHAVENGAQLKQHALASYSRAVDPTPLAALRPGAAAAAIAGCLALGGGTTYYCVSQNVNPIGGLTHALTRPAEPRTPRGSQGRGPQPADTQSDARADERGDSCADRHTNPQADAADGDAATGTGHAAADTAAGARGRVRADQRDHVRQCAIAVARRARGRRHRHPPTARGNSSREPADRQEEDHAPSAQASCPRDRRRLRHARRRPRGAGRPRRRVSGRRLPGRLAVVHDPPVRGLRDPGHADPPRL